MSLSELLMSTYIYNLLMNFLGKEQATAMFLALTI